MRVVDVITRSQKVSCGCGVADCDNFTLFGFKESHIVLVVVGRAHVTAGVLGGLLV